MESPTMSSSTFRSSFGLLAFSISAIFSACRSNHQEASRTWELVDGCSLDSSAAVKAWKGRAHVAVMVAESAMIADLVIIMFFQAGNGMQIRTILKEKALSCKSVDFYSLE